MSTIITVWLAGVIPAFAVFYTALRWAHMERHPDMPWDDFDQKMCLILSMLCASLWFILWVFVAIWVLDDWRNRP